MLLNSVGTQTPRVLEAGLFWFILSYEQQKPAAIHDSVVFDRVHGVEYLEAAVNCKTLSH